MTVVQADLPVTKATQKACRFGSKAWVLRFGANMATLVSSSEYTVEGENLPSPQLFSDHHTCPSPSFSLFSK